MIYYFLRYQKSCFRKVFIVKLHYYFMVEKKETKAEDKVEGKEVGKVFSYFTKIGVAAIEVTGNLKVGDKIRIKGATTDFEQKVDSMQVEGKNVDAAKKGDSIGIKVKDRVRPHDVVYVI